MIINCTAVIIFLLFYVIFYFTSTFKKALFVAFTCFCFLLIFLFFYLFLDVIKCPFFIHYL